jgi:aminoglycoside phosphotransferase (APT) family kinase protein
MTVARMNAETIRHLAAKHLGGSTPQRVAALGRGLDHDCYLVGDSLVVRRARDGAGEPDVERKAELLALVAEVSPVPVPRPVFVAPDDGCLAYEWLDGVPLLEVARRLPEAVAARLGRPLRALHERRRRSPRRARVTSD